MLIFLFSNYVCIKNALVKLNLFLLNGEKSVIKFQYWRNKLTKGAVQGKRMPIVSPCPRTQIAGGEPIGGDALFG